MYAYMHACYVCLVACVYVRMYACWLAESLAGRRAGGRLLDCLLLYTIAMLLTIIERYHLQVIALTIIYCRIVLYRLASFCRMGDPAGAS